MNATAPPLGHPAIPPIVSQDILISIVTVHHKRAPSANRAIQHGKLNTTTDGTRATRQGANGVHIFLRRIGPNGGQHCFHFGRETKPNEDRNNVDVYLPSSDGAIGLRQFSLVPVWACNGWRLQSTSEMITTVNGVPIQVHTTRTKNQENPLPHAVYLKQAEVNVIFVDGIRIDIWLMKSVRQMYGEQDFRPSKLKLQIQDVASRPEPWVLERWNLTDEQVSTKTFRAIHRFTGEKETAKVFGTEQRQWQLRDQEFLMFNKQEVDSSVVRYLHAIDINTTPAVITDSHEGFVTYASLRDQIRRSHPGLRFEIATKLIRRLFRAVAFMHFHSILHEGVSDESVLLRIVDEKVERVLLVNYSTARPFPSGELSPMAKILDDGQAAMKLVEDCCDIWAFRNAPTTAAQGEYSMQRRTTELHEQYTIVRRVAADFFERQGYSRNSEKGKKLERLLNETGNLWTSARSAQAQNLRLREVSALSRSKIDGNRTEWDGANVATTGIGQQPYMILSLGHPYLDSLSNQLYVKRWDVTPHEVCTKFKEYGGDLEEPWQTFGVQRATSIVPTGAGYTIEPIMAWLATCCEIYPEWRKAIEAEAERHVHPQDNLIHRAQIGALHAALRSLGRLPVTMIAMLDRLMDTNVLSIPVEENYQIWYHIPSRHFNMTQLHRLATPNRLQTVITENQIHCDNFVEVRGDPRVQGCYAPLSFLMTSCNVLGLELPRAPDLTIRPTLDPSDFSRVQPGRIVLARPGMLGYGSMIRSAEQVNWLNPKAPPLFETASAFIPTNFGDMKVIPKLPYGVNHERPQHWSKYKTAEETEASVIVSKCRISSSKAPSRGKERAAHAEIDVMNMDMEIDMDVGMNVSVSVQESAIAKLLRAREAVRAAARLPAKRIKSATLLRALPTKRAPEVPMVVPPSFSDSFMQRMEDQAQGPAKTPHPNLSAASALLGPGMSFLGKSFIGRNSALLTVPPNDPTSINQSFTVADEHESLEEDWKAVNALLEKLPDDEDDCMDLTGFNLDAIHNREEDETEAGPDAAVNLATKDDTIEFSNTMYDAGSHGRRAKGKSPAYPLATSSPLAKTMTRSFDSRQQSRGRKSFVSFGPHIVSRLGKKSFGPSAARSLKHSPKSHKRNKSSTSDVTMSFHNLLPTELSPGASPRQSNSGTFGSGYGHTARASKVMSSGSVPISEAREQYLGNFGTSGVGMGFSFAPSQCMSFNGNLGDSFDQYPPTDAMLFSHMLTRPQSTNPARADLDVRADISNRSSQPKIFSSTASTTNMFGGVPMPSASNANAPDSLSSTDSNSSAGGGGDDAGAQVFANSSSTPNILGHRTVAPSQNTNASLQLNELKSPIGPTGIYSSAPQNVDEDMLDTDEESWFGGSQAERGCNKDYTNGEDGSGGESL